ncbi:putative signal transducing protein [Kordia sp.]|uniref:putative signal transducing protein n=1 Tax=Kordia sp. TaxID=1965332 RepID=UPI003D6C6945
MDRVKIYTSNIQIEIMDAKNILHEAGINFFEINKMDSSYAGMLGGSIELYVDKKDVEKALPLLADLKQA